MKMNILCLLAFFTYEIQAFADTKYIPIMEDLEFNEAAESADCDVGSIWFSEKANHIEIQTNNSNLTVDKDEIPDNGDFIVGDMTGNGFCDLAVAYGKSDVNESYTLLLYDPINEKLLKSNIGTITNPEFKKKKIISSYRDAARWNKDTLHYSENLKDFFVYEKRTDINNALERVSICSEQTCHPSVINYKLSSIQASAVITAKQAKFYDNLPDGAFTERRGYLINGDKVYLLDFSQSHGKFYYKVVYFNKTNTMGWIQDSKLAILPIDK